VDADVLNHLRLSLQEAFHRTLTKHASFSPSQPCSFSLIISASYMQFRVNYIIICRKFVNYMLHKLKLFH